MSCQICKRCVMDNASDPTIHFDSDGYCNYCTTKLMRAKSVCFPNEEGQRRWDEMLAQIKDEDRGLMRVSIVQRQIVR